MVKMKLFFSGYYCLYHHTFLKGYDCHVGSNRYYTYYDFREEFEKEYIPKLKSKGYDVEIIEKDKDNEVKYVISW